MAVRANTSSACCQPEAFASHLPGEGGKEAENRGRVCSLAHKHCRATIQERVRHVHIVWTVAYQQQGEQGYVCLAVCELTHDACSARGRPVTGGRKLLTRMQHWGSEPKAAVLANISFTGRHTKVTTQLRLLVKGGYPDQNVCVALQQR